MSRSKKIEGDGEGAGKAMGTAVAKSDSALTSKS